MGSRQSGIAFGLAALVGACLDDPGFACDDDAQCLFAADGVCEPSGWCSYPDPSCASLRRYGPYAPGDVARACVTDSETDDGSTEPPVSSCGNGSIEPPETCDDRNRTPGDTCHPLCVEPGTAIWTVTYDGEAHSEDRGFGVAVDLASATFYVVGFSTVSPEQSKDILLQRRWIENGALLWSVTHAGDARADDLGEHVAITTDGDPIVVGLEATLATGGDIWLRRYTPEGEPRWTFTHDEQGGDDRGQGVAVIDGGVIVVAGNVSIDRAGVVDTDAWLRRIDPDGAPIGEPTVRGRAGSRDEAIDVIAAGDDVIVTGLLTDDAAQHQVWTARYAADDTLAWEHLATAELVGNEARGVGLALDGQGGSATAGVLSNDIWVQRYDALGTPGATFTHAGTAESHDEAADIAFAADGSFIVVGFVDFRTTGFAKGDIWVRCYEPDGSVRWTDTYDGPAGEIDKALAVDLTDHYGAIVAGYETVPGQARDVWIRRYAL